MKKVVLHEDPLVEVYKNVLPKFFCNYICNRYADRFKPSKVMDNDTATDKRDEYWRTSSDFFLNRFNHVSYILRYFASKAVNVPTERMENVSLTKYEVGEQYKPHYDYFQTNYIESNELVRRQGQRIATVIFYLKEPEFGGHTGFQRLGISVPPSVGDMLVFRYDYPWHHINTLTIHSGEPVLKGTKIIATIWVREKRTFYTF